MKKNYALLFIGIVLLKTSFGQITFQQKFNVEGACAHQTSDGGYITCGYGLINDTSFLHWYSSLIKLNPGGDTAWTKKYYNDSIGFFTIYTEQTADGGYILTGGTTESNSDVYNVNLIKTDANGNIAWSSVFGHYGYDHAREVHQTSDGGYIVVGYLQHTSGGTEDIFLVKTNATGTVLWSKVFGTINTDEAYSVKQTTDGGYIIIGVTPAINVDDIYLIKTDNAGNLLWSNIYTNNNMDAHNIFETTDGGFIITGTIDIAPGTGAKGNVLLLKTDSIGNVLWAKKYVNGKPNSGLFASITNDNGFIIAGVASSGNLPQPETDILAIKTDSSGNYQWAKSYGDSTNSGFPSDEQGWYVKQTFDNGYLLSGISIPRVWNFRLGKLYIIKTNSNGNSGCKEAVLSMTESSTTISVNPLATSVSSGFTLYNIPITISNGNDSVHTLCFSPLGIADNGEQPTDFFTLFPNPTSSSISLTFNEEQKNSTLKIIDVVGKEVFHSTINEKQTTIEISALAKGIYFVEVINLDLQVMRKKIIKE